MTDKTYAYSCMTLTNFLHTFYKTGPNPSQTRNRILSTGETYFLEVRIV